MINKRFRRDAPNDSVRAVGEVEGIAGDAFQRQNTVLQRHALRVLDEEIVNNLFPVVLISGPGALRYCCDNRCAGKDL